MSKTKKSKLLASMLCAAVMAGLHAAPVMAGDAIITGGSEGIKITIKKDGDTSGNRIYFDRELEWAGRVFGGLTITPDQLAAGIKCSDVEFGKVTANTLNVGGKDVVKLNKSRVDVNADVINGGFLKVTNANGAMVFAVDSKGVVRAANGKFGIADDGTVSVGGDETNGKAIINGTTGDITTKGNVYAVNGSFDKITTGTITAANGSFKVEEGNGETVVAGSMVYSKNQNGSYGMLNGNQLTLQGDGNKFSVVNGNVETSGTVNAAKDVVANGTSLVDVGEKTTALEEKTQDISYENGKTTVGGVTFNNGFVDASVVKAHSVFFDGGTLSAGGISAVQGKFVVDANGSVKSFGDVQSANYSLEEIGKNLGDLETGVSADLSDLKQKTSTLTVTEGTSKGTITNISSNLNVQGDITTTSNGDVKTAAGASLNGLNEQVKEDALKIHNLQVNTTDIKYADGVTEIGKGALVVNNEGYVTINNGMLTADAESGYVTMGNKIEFDTASGSVRAKNFYTDKYDLNSIGSQLDELETGVGTDITDLKRKTTDIEYADGVTTIAGATEFTENGMQVGTTVINKDGSIGAGNGNFTVTADGEVIVRGENGATSITGDAITIGDTVIKDGMITTHKAEIGGVEIANGRVDGVDVSELAGSVFDGSKDIAELQRITTGMDYQNGVTSFSGDITFRHNGDTVSLGGLVDKVNDIYDRTSGISKDENGNTVIDGGLVVDGDTTGTGGSITGNGDMNISGDGQIGGDLDVAGSVNAGNVNTGNINAGKGTIGGIHMENGEMTVGDTTVNGDGVNVGGENGTSITDKDVVINKGTDNEVSLSNVGNRVDNLEQGMASMSNRISKVEDRIDKVGAMSAAIANLRTMGYDPTAPTEIAVGIGQYRSETGAALGLFHYPNKDFMLSLSVSTSGDEVMGGIGATWKFGRKSPEQMLAAEKEKAAKAKLAKAEAMKKAAAEAKVAEQQAKHAKMAAEKAAK